MLRYFYTLYLQFYNKFQRFSLIVIGYIFSLILSYFFVEKKNCESEFQLFDQKYLKGVLKPYYTTTNSNVTLNDCMEMCCNQPPLVILLSK